MQIRFTRCASALALVLGTTGWAGATAFAQEADQAQTSGPQESTGPQAGGSREVVVVTANKREESVQDIAVAVTAITAQDKQELGIISITDLTNVTPGLSYTPGNERVTLRGIGRLSNSFGADPGVANYNDGIYTPFATLAGKDPLFIERVEVLRGPQGTLYGRNAIGGAINTISKRPSDDFTAEVVVGAGNYDYRKFGAALSGPITDTLRYRAVGFQEVREGVDYNFGTNETMGWEIDDYFLELQFEGEIGDRFSWWLKGTDAGYDKAGPPGGETSSFNNQPYETENPARWFNTGGLTPNPAWGFTADPAVLNVTQLGNLQVNPFASAGVRAFNTNEFSRAQLKEYDEYIFEGVYEFDTFDFKYIGGYTYYDYQLPGEGDPTPITSLTYAAVTPQTGAAVPACAGTVNLPVSVLPPAAAGCAALAGTKTIFPNVTNFYGESRSLFSNEINLISTTDSPLQWLFGVYQYQDNQQQPGQVQTLDDEPIADQYLAGDFSRIIANPNRYLQFFQNTSLQHAYGVYGQLDYALNDQWKVTGGLRYSKDVKESKEEGFLACYIVCRALGVPADYWNYTQTNYGAVVAADANAYFDDRGFDAATFDEFVFLPVEGPLEDGLRGWPSCRHYYFFEPRRFRQYRLWKTGLGFSMANRAGSRLGGRKLRLAPESLVLRHYIFRSQAHAREKLVARRFAAEELERGWHGDRNGFGAEAFTFPPASALKMLSSPDSFVFERTDPWKDHYWIEPAGGRPRAA